MEFGKFVMENRLKNNISLRKFSQMIGISPTYLSDIENGRRKPTNNYEIIESISNALDLDTANRTRLFDLVAKEKKELPKDIEEYLINNPKKIAILRREIKKDNEQS